MQLTHLIKTTILVIFFITTSNVQGQSVTSQLGAVNTQFTILCENDTLNVIDQAILLRGLAKSTKNYDTYGEGAYGYGLGYGLRVYKLEFISKNKLIFKKKQKYNDKYRLQFFTEDRNLLLDILLYPDGIKTYANGGSPFVYSINLSRVPLICLNHTKYIYISRTKHYGELDE